jgi:Mn-containing catalase
MTREITHMKAFTAALESIGKPRFSIGKIPPTPRLVDQFFNDSTGQGDEGEIDARGPWNEGNGWDFVEAPAFQAMRPGASNGGDGAVDDRSTQTTETPELLQEVLVEALQDLLHAEGQLVKALPRMVKAARSMGLTQILERHLEQTMGHVERLNQCFELLGVPAKGKPCKGMAGLLDEGAEVMEEGEEKEDLAADLALIGSGQKVEHYEISSYVTARNMASQIGQPDVGQLLSLNLAEEETANALLAQVARELMSLPRSRSGKGAAPAPSRSRKASKAAARQ